MPKVTGGNLAVEVLKRHGVGLIFSLTGIQITSIYDACIDAGIKIIDARHEQASGFMADAYARLTASPAVCLVSAGPAFSNAITPLVVAFRAGSPLVLLSGSAPLKGRDRMAFQELDQLSLARPVTKWARQVTETERIPEYISWAFKEAISGRPGPVYLDLPEDVINRKVEPDRPVTASPLNPFRPAPDPAEISRAVRLLKQAKRPITLAGSGVWFSQAWKELERFVELYGIPTFTVNMGRGCLSDDHPLSLRGAHLAPGGAFLKALKRCDLLIIVGSRFAKGEELNPRTKVIQIDIDPAEVGRMLPVEVGIAGDAKATLSLLTMELEKKGVSSPPAPSSGGWAGPWARWLKEILKGEERGYLSKDGPSGRPIHPFHLCLTIDRFLDRDAIVVADGGDTSVWMRIARRVYGPGLYLDSGPMRCVGLGLPFALAARLKEPNRQVLLISGDGSMGFNFMEFNTAIRHKMPVVVVVNNDKGWGMIRHGQEMTYGKGRGVAAQLGLVRYDEMVKALGGYGELVTQEREIEPALKRAFQSGLPACINVLTDPEVASPEVARGG